MITRKTLYTVLMLGACYLQQSCSKQADVPNPQIQDSVPEEHPQENPLANYPENRETASTIYIVSMYPATLYAFNAIDGKQKWSVQMDGDFGTSVLAIGGVVTFIGETNTIQAYDTSGNKKWTFDLPQRYNDRPLVADHGTILAETLDYIFAVNASDGQQKWKLTKPVLPGHQQVGRISVLDGMVYTTGSGIPVAVDIATGQIKWQMNEVNSLSNMVVYKNLIYGTDGKNLIVADPETGTVINTYADVLESDDVNVKYGRIYQSSGNVLDSADPSKKMPRIQACSQANFEALWKCPILGDGKAIGVLGVSDAMSGASYCEPFFQPDTRMEKGWFAGSTYVNGILYYTSAKRLTYDGDGNPIYFSELYAFDVNNKKSKWRTVIPDDDIYNQVPCVVTKEGSTFRSIETFR
ncbi:MAG: PQQ-like beta-propeller repeat protein [Agriterribacter sp.]